MGLMCSEQVQEAGGGVRLMYSFAGHCKSVASSVSNEGLKQRVAESAIHYRRTALADVPGLDKG